MKIINNEMNYVKIKDLNVGDCFWYDDEVFVLMRSVVHECQGSPTPCNSFCFNDNEVYYFDDDNEVIKLNEPKLIFENKEN